jgi:lipopolysaccharide transport system ATP-binding protein
MIRLEGAGKTYRLYRRPADRLWQFVLPRRKPWFQDFSALQGVSLELRRGEVLGIVGVNGAGKSTLLQLVAGTLSPSTGRVQTRGRVAALLELGSGFNPEFTGRENVMLNAAVLGLQREEIEARMDAIVAFADIGPHIDQPVKTYSSGMYVRLAFAIATSVEPDVLIIDEALSVGDGAFARRSFDRIMEIKRRGATVLFCSHMLYHVEVFCDRALWLDAGRVRALGPVSSVLSAYQEFLDGLNAPAGAAALDSTVPAIAASRSANTHEAEGSTQATPLDGAPSHPAGHARIQKVEVLLDGHAGQELYGTSGESVLEMRMTFASDPALPAPSAALVISSDAGKILATNLSAQHGVVVSRDAQGQGTVSIQVLRVPMNKGRFRVGAYLMCEQGLHVYQWIDPVAHVHLHREGHDQGFWTIAGAWRSELPPRT